MPSRRVIRQRPELGRKNALDIIVSHMKTLRQRIASPDEAVELSLSGRGLVLHAALFLGALYFVAYPSDYFILFHWRWLSGIWAALVLVSLLRHVPWSPFYIGPTLTLTSSHISGPGGWGHSSWTVTWDEIEKIDWGRYGLFIYKKGRRNGEGPILQVGVGGPILVRHLNERLGAYIAGQPRTYG